MDLDKQYKYKKLSEDVEDWASFKLRDCMPQEEDFNFVIKCIQDYRNNKEDSPLYCSPRGLALCTAPFTLALIKYVLICKLLKMPEAALYANKLIEYLKQQIDKEDMKEIINFVSGEWPKYAPKLGKYTFIEELEKKATLNEASALTNEDKMDLWYKGQRGFNYKAASDSKLEDCYNICVRKGYKVEASTLRAEGTLRGLSWASQKITKNVVTQPEITLEVDDFYKSIFVRCASCKTTPANIADTEAENLLDHLSKEVLNDKRLTSAEKATRMRKNDFVCLIYFICLKNKAAYDAVKFEIEYHYNLDTNQIREICKKAMSDPEILNWITHLLSLDDLQENLQEDIEKHEALNEKLWDGMSLKQEVSEKINAIVNEFIQDLQEDEIDIKVSDIILVGSNCSYNYTKDSDLDIHIIADTKNSKYPENLAQKIYSAYRTIFNKKFDIDFYGIPVEIFVETEESPRVSNGIYSVMQEKWIKEPVLEDIPELDKVAFEAAFKPWEDRYNELLSRVNKVLSEALKQGNKEEAKRIQAQIDFYEDRSDDYYTQNRYDDILDKLEQELQEDLRETPDLKTEIEQLVNDIYEQRKAGLSSDLGEWSIENLIFKEFRNKGYLDNLKDLKNKLTSKTLCLESIKKLEESSKVIRSENVDKNKVLSYGCDFSGSNEIFYVEIDNIIDTERGLAETEFRKEFPDESKAKAFFYKKLDSFTKNNKNIAWVRESLEMLTGNNIILQESGLFNLYNISEVNAKSIINKLRNSKLVEWVQYSVNNKNHNAYWLGNKPETIYNIYGKIK